MLRGRRSRATGATSIEQWLHDRRSCILDAVKMYILIKASVPPGFAVLAAAHASLACYLRFRDSPEVAEWLAGPFYKAVCRVGDAEFEAARACEDHVVLTESALGGSEVAIAFKPRAEWPRAFRSFPLYR